MIADAGRQDDRNSRKPVAKDCKVRAAEDRCAAQRLLRETTEPAPRRKRPGLY